MSSPPVLEEVKQAMIDYYFQLSRMPHYPPDSLRIPPPEGWSDVDIKTLRDLGRSDAAIEFVRHLPYLEPCLNCEKAWITRTAPAIAYHRGETWPAYMTGCGGVPIPPHLIYLSMAVDARWGTCLILDTERGAIVEVSAEGGPLDESWHGREDQYEQLPDTEKWTAHRTLSAADFFSQERVRMTALLKIPVPPSSRSESPQYYIRARNQIEERNILAVEDEWEADHEDDPDWDPERDDDAAETAEADPDVMEDVAADDDQIDEAEFEDRDLAGDDDGSHDDEYDDMELDDGELEGLKADDDEYMRNHAPPPGPGVGRWVPAMLPAETQRAYYIYKLHGWPYDTFDVERCRTELLEFSAQIKAEADARRAKSQPKSKEEWYENRRQLYKKKQKAEGKAWDEEKEKTQTAQDWYLEFQGQKS